MTALSVNLNKVALLRNTRTSGLPDLVAMCELCLHHGADGITVHPRPDQRHIRTSDVIALRPILKKHAREFNLEGNPLAAPRATWPGFMTLALETRPEQCTLVPDSDEQVTSDHGWDLATQAETLHPLIKRLQTAGIRVSLFMDPVPQAISTVAAVGAERIEIYTEEYAVACAAGDNTAISNALSAIQQCVQIATEHCLSVNAGHDLNLDNLPQLISAVPQLAEVSIGHALTADALRYGFPQTISKYRAILARNVGV